MSRIAILHTLTLALLGALLLIGPPLRQLGQQADTAQEEFTAAIALTQTNLAKAARTLTEDSAFVSHLRWQMHNSASNLASGQLRSGEIDELQIVGDKCQKYLRSTLKNDISFDCAANQDTLIGKDKQLWLDAAGTPLLVSSVRIKKLDRPTTLLAFVRLDQDWLAQQSKLARLVSPLQLSLAANVPSNRQRHVLSQTEVSSNKLGAALLSGRNALAWLPRKLVATDLAASPVVWLLLVINAVLTLAIWSRAHLAFRQTSDRFEDFLTWCRQLRSNAKEISLGHQPPPLAKLNMRGHLQLAQEELLGAVNELNDGILLQQREIAAGENRIAQLEQVIQAANLEKAQMARYRSLALQTETFAQILQNDVLDFRDRLQDLNDITAHGMHPEVQKISQLLAQWQQQISERGARTFIRSLAETTITAKQTALDQQLGFLQQTSSHLLDALLAMSQQKQHLQDRLQDLQALATFWSDFDTSELTHASASLPQALNDAQRLANMQLRSVTTLKFENQLDAATNIQLPIMPGSALVSMLFHLYLSTAYRSLDTGKLGRIVSLTTQARELRGQQMLIVSATSSVDDQAPVTNPDLELVNRHLHLARTIACGYGMQMRILPAVADCQPFALTWDIAAKPLPRPNLSRQVDVMDQTH